MYAKTTFGIKFEIAESFEILEKDDCIKFWEEYQAGEKYKSFVFFGGGSNMILSDQKKHNILFIKNKGIETASDDVGSVILKVATGEVWQDVVEFALENGLAGIEALCAIPGRAGGAPVQNIGAYGAEIKDVLESVEVFDLEKCDFKTFTNSQCEFSYRNSIFKKPENKNKYIIVSVNLKLSKSGESLLPKFKKVQDYFKGKYSLDDEGVSKNFFPIKEISEVITNIRWSTLPNPDELGNVGSFFHNPIITKKQFVELIKILPNVPNWEMGDDKVKIAAGYLIDQAGLRGYRMRSLGTYEKNALVIVNYGEASESELLEFIGFIKKTILDKYKIEIIVEPSII